MLIAYFVVAMIGGILCSFLASAKDRDALGWFVIGFLLPLIGLILVLVLPSGQTATPSQTQSAVRQSTCLDDLQKLADLRDRKVLSDEEFEAKKRLVLERADRTPKPNAEVALPEGSVSPTDETDAKALLAIAQTHHFAKEFEDARREYQSLIVRFPSTKQALVARQQIENLKSA